MKKKLQSTRQQSIGNTSGKEPPLEPLTCRTHHIYVNTFDTAGKIYTDLLGRFPILSYRNNRHLFILYD